MSITKAIGNAMSGLRVNSRQAEIASRNVSNASVEGYTAKTLALSHEVHGGQPGGVRADGVRRAGDPFLVAERRGESARSGALSTEGEALRRIADAVMDPDGGDGLHDRMRKLEGALRSLADTPESAALRREAAEAAQGVADKLNTLSTDATRLRMDADREIGRQVDTVNGALSAIERLTREIQTTAAAGRDVSALEDERERQIEIVNAIIPVKSATPVNGGLQLIAEGGGTLMAGSARPLSFEPSGDVAGFEGLAQGGKRVDDPATQAATGGDTAREFRGIGLGGGSLEALFRVRDEIGRDYAAQLDAVARDLIERFQGDASFVDGSTAMAGFAKDDGAAPPATPREYLGLFADYDAAGAAEIRFPADAAAADAAEAGLARRIRVAAPILSTPALLADPSEDTQRLMARDPGATPAPDTFPSALYHAMRAQRAVASDAGPSAALGLDGARTTLDMTTEWVALRERAAGAAEREASFASGRVEALREEELAASAVDTDEEMRRLLAIEKAYAANARVLQVADQMLSAILEI